METTSAFNLAVRLDNVAVITIDVPDEKMNTLKAEFGVQVRAMLRQIRENKAIRGLVFISAKPDNFIAGADINMMALPGRWALAGAGLSQPHLYRRCENGTWAAGGTAWIAARFRWHAAPAASGGRQYGAGDDFNR